MSAKKLTQMLPPKRSARREVGVNVRFTHDEHDELLQIAEYRDITVTELIYHVVAQVGLPTLREEMDAEIVAAQAATATVVQPEPPTETPPNTFSTQNAQTGLSLVVPDPKSGPDQPRRADGVPVRPVSRLLPDSSA